MAAGERGREAFDRRAWGEAYAALAAMDPAELGPEDLERLAVAAYLVGEERASVQAWERAHDAHLAAAAAGQAARCAMWLGALHFLRGEVTRAGGWLARAEHAGSSDHDGGAGEGAQESRRSALMAANLQALLRGDVQAARSLGADMVALGRRLEDRELLCWGLMCVGEAEIALGETGRGLQRLDEAMVLLTAGELPPLPAGIVYCAAIDACMAAYDLRRAEEWTDALTTWCTAQPGLVPFRGQCLVHRSQLMVARGAWDDAAAEAERAHRRLSDPPGPALGLACYQQGEVHRLRGDHAGAERAYRAAAASGHDPAPGLALLRLAEGDAAAAAALVRRMLEEHRHGPARPAVLGAGVEILLAVGDAGGARGATDELEALAVPGAPPLLHAIAALARGSVLLDGQDAGEALPHLRRACRLFGELHLPYEAARAEVRIALACRALGDAESADLALDAARATFEGLGAAPDLAALDRLAAGPQVLPGPLTDRELEVLRLVAAGRTNREVATALTISPHTVGRHLQNIFMKLGVSSRAAATAYAYEHGLT
jgi:DNA-binding CsgD family transcriptional regulator